MLNHHHQVSEYNIMLSNQLSTLIELFKCTEATDLNCILLVH